MFVHWCRTHFGLIATRFDDVSTGLLQLRNCKEAKSTNRAMLSQSPKVTARAGWEIVRWKFRVFKRMLRLRLAFESYQRL
jgi:hypothetical protein